MITLLGAAQALDLGEVNKLADRAGRAAVFNGKSSWTLHGELLGAFTVVRLSDGVRSYTGVAKCSVEDYDRQSNMAGLQIAARRAFDRAFGLKTHPGEPGYRHKYERGRVTKLNVGALVNEVSDLTQIERGAA